MRTIRSLLLAGVALAGLTGCATHPIPDDVTLNTYAIVDRLRCEARDAVIDQLVEELEYQADQLAREGAKLDGHTTDLDRNDAAQLKTLAQHLRSDTLAIVDFVADYDDPGKSNIYSYIPQLTKTRISNYRQSTVAMRFDLDMLQNNDNTFDLSFSDPSPLNIFKLSIKSGSERSRENKRTFDVFYSFDGLLKGDKSVKSINGKELAKHCASNEIAIDLRRPNMLYPISGSIGLKEMMNTFLDIAEHVGLKNAAEFADKLTFTTKVFANPSPSVDFSSTSTRFHIDRLGNSDTLERKDTHEVTVALALKLPEEPAPRGGGEPPPSGGKRAAGGHRTSLSSAPSPTPASDASLEAGIAQTQAEAARILEKGRLEDFVETQEEILQRLEDIEQ